MILRGDRPIEAHRNDENDHPAAGARPEHPAEGTAPPANPKVDEAAVQEGEDKLEQAGGGH